MKVLIVCNNAFHKGNGLCTAVMTLYHELMCSGVEVRLMACRNDDPDGPQPDYPLKHFKFPFFERIIYTNGFRYASADRKLMENAIAWADVVHLEEGFPLEAKAASIAERMGKPCVGSYHLLTENILANLGMKRDVLINDIVTFAWRKLVYDRCAVVHCPTSKVRDYLLEHGFKSRMEVISNGVRIMSGEYVSNVSPEAPFIILCTGRLSNEKSQMTLLEAMKISRHSREIQLVFAGKGPKEKKYRRIAARLMGKGVLAHEPEFGFFAPEQLRGICSRAYLYVHCAWVEVEGLSCLEALREGTVPVIAEGKYTATSQFALDSRSIFPVGDPKALAERIDWWIEHPAERIAMGKEYSESASCYSLDGSIARMIEMYEKAIGS